MCFDFIHLVLLVCAFVLCSRSQLCSSLHTHKHTERDFNILVTKPYNDCICLSLVVVVQSSNMSQLWIGCLFKMHLCRSTPYCPPSPPNPLCFRSLVSVCLCDSEIAHIHLRCLSSHITIVFQEWWQRQRQWKRERRQWRNCVAIALMTGSLFPICSITMPIKQYTTPNTIYSYRFRTIWSNFGWDENHVDY